MINHWNIIKYNFSQREAADLEELNQILSTMKVRELILKDHEGYLETTMDGEDNLLGYRYGLESGTLVGLSDENGHIYRIDTWVTDSAVSKREFEGIWRSVNPDRVMRALIQAPHEEAVGYAILHHQKIKKSPAKFLQEAKADEGDISA